MASKSPLISRLALVLLGVVPAVGAVLGAAGRLRWNRLGKPSPSSRANLITALIGLVMLALPQLMAEGPVGETFWIAASASSLVLAIFLVSVTLKHESGQGAGAVTLGLSAMAIAGPALWRLLASDDFTLWWVNHTNEWASMAVMVAAAAVPLYRRKLWIHAQLWLFLAAVLVAAAVGSRTAIFAVVAGVFATLAVGATTRRRGVHLPLLAVLGLAIGASIVILSPLGTRLAGLVPRQTTNLVIASEEIGGEYWTRRGVEVLTEPGEDGINWFRIRSIDDKALDRVHQRFDLAPREIRTLALEYRQTDSGGGIVAFSEPHGSLIVPFSSPQDLRVSGEPDVLDVIQVKGDAGWTLLKLTVHNTSQYSLEWRVGFATSLRDGASSELNVRRVRMADGYGDEGYAPTYEQDRIRDLAALSAGQRVGYAKGVLGLLKERPLFGHGSAKPFYVLLDDFSLRPGAAASDRPWHAHSLIGDVVVRFGFVGLAGLVLIVASAVRVLPVGQRSVAMPYLVVVLVLGFGDATFFNAGGPFIFVPLLMAIGSSTR